MAGEWKRVFREGFAPSLPTAGLVALRQALVEDDPHLMQGGTTQPPPLMCVADWPVEAACAIGYAGWKADRETVGEVEEFFAVTCLEADRAMNEPAACRHFLNWFDDTPRDQMRKELAAEVESILAEREAAGAA